MRIQQRYAYQKYQIHHSLILQNHRTIPYAILPPHLHLKEKDAGKRNSVKSRKKRTFPSNDSNPQKRKSVQRDDCRTGSTRSTTYTTPPLPNPCRETCYLIINISIYRKKVCSGMVYSLGERRYITFLAQLHYPSLTPHFSAVRT